MWSLILQLGFVVAFGGNSGDDSGGSFGGFSFDGGSYGLSHIGCPRYEDYARRLHRPYSLGPLGLPSQRPVPQCRLFKSQAIDDYIQQMTDKIKDKDLARLFENCLPNTLDTTIKWHDPDENDSFIITGDINAQWLRDSTFQLEPYHQFMKQDEKLKQLIGGAVQTQAKFVNTACYCNAFQALEKSGIHPVKNDYTDNVSPPFDSDRVFECKYEIDSPASFLRLSWQYYSHTKDDSMFTKEWMLAIGQVFRVIREQSQPSFDTKTGIWNQAYYTFQRQTNTATETLALGGAGYPVNEDLDLVRSAFRPSDDTTIMQYFIPGNAMLSVELDHLAGLLKHAAKAGVAGAEAYIEKAATFSKLIRKAVLEHGVFEHPEYGKVLAYEIDGYGGRIVMDDANVPSLLSLPLLGFMEKDDPIYVNTRKLILSKKTNPYYHEGSKLQGIGSPHTPMKNVWPMSLMVQIMTSNDEKEIEQCLEEIKTSTAGLGLMHESVNAWNTLDFSRPWFAWANAYFALTVMNVAERLPHLIYG